MASETIAHDRGMPLVTWALHAVANLVGERGGFSVGEEPTDAKSGGAGTGR